jgi:hypothetical protein
MNTDKQRNKTRGLIPFQKGISGNPKGRPRKEVCITSWLKEFADKSITAPIDAKNLTYAQAAALSAWKAAAKGELQEYNFIIERIEGRVPQPITGDSNQPFVLKVVYDKGDTSQNQDSTYNAAEVPRLESKT